MLKVSLIFPATDKIAEFIVQRKIARARVSLRCTLTVFLAVQEIRTAISDYGATIERIFMHENA
jgi:hypothetical protein